MNPPTPEDQVDNNFVLRGEFQVLGFCFPADVAFKDFHARADPTVMQQLNACIGAESDRSPVQVAAAAASRPGSRSPRRRVTPWVRVRPNDVAIDVEDSPAKASATVPDSQCPCHRMRRRRRTENNNATMLWSVKPPLSLSVVAIVLERVSCAEATRISRSHAVRIFSDTETRSPT